MLQQFFSSAAKAKGCSSLISKNILLSGKRTSMRLEPDMWDALLEISSREGMTIHDLCTLIDQRRVSSSLTAAVRVFLMTYYRQAAYTNRLLKDGSPTTANGSQPRKLALDSI